MGLTVGAIADDFTGALDLANNFVRAGLSVAHVNGVDESATPPADVDVVVVALKTRTAPIEEAIAHSREALRWLVRNGATKFYVKYCSTFDSTPSGNIGPIVDMAMDELKVAQAVAVPSFPDTGRTVFQGHLFVGDRLLAESSMRHHPLTPMTDSDVVRLLAPQTRRAAASIARRHVAAGRVALRGELDRLTEEIGPSIVVVDAIDNNDLQTIADAVAVDALVTGGSGLALSLPAAWGLNHQAAGELPVPRGHRAIVAGSVSTRTNEQVAQYPGPKFRIEPALLGDTDVVTEAVNWAVKHLHSNRTPLIYSTASPDDVAQAQLRLGALQVGAAIEEALSSIAVRLVAHGVGQLVVAGGETSGACMQALGIRELRIGRQIDPGVPWAHGRSADGHDLHIALKSGNFGAEDFFTKAFEELYERV